MTTRTLIATVLVCGLAGPAAWAQPAAAPAGQSSLGNPLNQNPERRDPAAIPAPAPDPDPRNSSSRPAEPQDTRTPDPRNSTSRPTPQEPALPASGAGLNVF